jgi:hypothetical protein
MMVEACILFVHHKNDEVTRAHLEHLRRLNPYPIVPLKNQSDEGIVGAIRPPHGEDPWHGADAPIYSWFARRGFDAARYIVLEWDCLMTIPVREYYAEVWDKKAGACTIVTPATHPCWYWFREIGLFSEELRPYAAGLVPLNGVFLSHEAMIAITSKTIPKDVFSELRLGTLLRAHAIELIEIPVTKGATNSWNPYLTHYEPGGLGLYHPVKFVEPGHIPPINLTLDRKIMRAVNVLAKLALGTRLVPSVFSRKDACRALEGVGWSTAEILNTIYFLRDNGVLSEEVTNDVFLLRFKLDPVAKRLATHVFE